MPLIERRQTRERLVSGEIDFVIGTHALLSEGVTFSRLRLVVTDEQHRFGVRQRARLREKAEIPPAYACHERDPNSAYISDGVIRRHGSLCD